MAPVWLAYGRRMYTESTWFALTKVNVREAEKHGTLCSGAENRESCMKLQSVFGCSQDEPPRSVLNKQTMRSVERPGFDVQPVRTVTGICEAGNWPLSVPRA